MDLQQFQHPTIYLLGAAIVIGLLLTIFHSPILFAGWLALFWGGLLIAIGFFLGKINQTVNKNEELLSEIESLRQDNVDTVILLNEVLETLNALRQEQDPQNLSSFILVDNFEGFSD